MAAGTPESGMGTTISASTGCSCARRRPSISRELVTERPEDDAVGARKVDVLENAVLVRLRRTEADGFDAGAGRCEPFRRVRLRGRKLRREDRRHRFRRQTTQASWPSGEGSLPRTSGRKPRGSRTA